MQATIDHRHVGGGLFDSLDGVGDLGLYLLDCEIGIKKSKRREIQEPSQHQKKSIKAAHRT